MHSYSKISTYFFLLIEHAFPLFFSLTGMSGRQSQASSGGSPRDAIVSTFSYAGFPARSVPQTSLAERGMRLQIAPIL
jgi:hypothetical protein